MSPGVLLRGFPRAKGSGLIVIGFFISGCVASKPPVLRWDTPRDIVSARQALCGEYPFLAVPTKEQMAAIKWVRLTEPVITCFPSTPKGKPDAPQQFLVTLSENLHKRLLAKNVFQIAGHNQPADAELRVEVFLLHNGTAEVDPFTRALLGVILIQPGSDPGIARYIAMLVHPETNHVLAGYSKVVSAITYGGDRYRTLATSLAKSIVDGAKELKKVASRDVSEKKR